MDYKRAQNLQQLSQSSDLPTLIENIRTEVDYDIHNLVGLGKRMPIPQELTNERAHHLKKAIYDRVVEIYGDNNEERLDNEKLLKVATCIAEDEFFAETKIESEQIERVIFDAQEITKSLPRSMINSASVISVQSGAQSGA